MDRSDLTDIPDAAAIADVGTLVSRYAPEMQPVRKWDDALISWTLLLMFGLPLAVILGLVQGNMIALALIVGVLLGSIPVGWWLTESAYRRAWREFEKGLEDEPFAVVEVVVARFEEEVTRQRTRMLGEHADWRRQRHRIEEAADEANRSMVYWRERAVEEDAGSSAESHHRVAADLEGKLRDALSELDRKGDALKTFFNECEARVQLLHRGGADMVESRRLADLVDSADAKIADAKLSLEGLAQQFLADAGRLVEALGAVQQLQLKDSAGYVAIENVEAVADEILASAGRDRDTIAELTVGIEGIGP